MWKQEDYYWLLNGVNSIEETRKRIDENPILVWGVIVLFVIGFRMLTYVAGYREYYYFSDVRCFIAGISISICVLLLMLILIYLCLRKTKYRYKAFAVTLFTSTIIFEETMCELVIVAGLDEMEVCLGRIHIPFLIVLFIIILGLCISIYRYVRCLHDFKKGFYHKTKRAELKKKKKELPTWLLLVLAAPILVISGRGSRKSISRFGFLGLYFCAYCVGIFLILMARPTACCWLYMKWAFSGLGDEIIER